MSDVPTCSPFRARRLRFALALAALAGCDDAGPAPPPVVPAEQVRQSLDQGLRPALAASGEAARAQVEAYLRQPGALAYQAEFVLGYTWQKEKNYTAAREHFERALELAPTYYPPLHFLGFACYYLGDLAAARQAFQEHLKRVPDEGESWFGLGLADFDLGRTAEAEQDFRRAIEKNEAQRAKDPQGRARTGEIAKARVRLGDVLIARNDLPAALEQLEQAAALSPDLVETWFKLSQLRAQTGDAAGAAQAQQRYRDLQARVAPTRGEGS